MCISYICITISTNLFDVTAHQCYVTALKMTDFFSTLSRTGSLFNCSKAQSEQIKCARSRSPAPCWRACHPSVKVADVQTSSDIQGSETRGEASGPVGSQFQFSTLGFRGIGGQSWKEQQAHTTGPVSPKKLKTDIDSALSGHDHILLQAIESAITKALQAPTRPSAVADCSEDVQSLRAEM